MAASCASGPGHFVELPGLRCTELPGVHPLGSKGDRWGDALELDARSELGHLAMFLWKPSENAMKSPSDRMKSTDIQNTDIILRYVLIVVEKFMLALSW